MSRIGKKPIEIPKDLEVVLKGDELTVKGPKGSLGLKLRPEILVEIKDNYIFVRPKAENKKSRAFWGMTRSLINNMIEGVCKGYQKKLEIRGVGWKAHLEGDKLVLSVGFSHPVEIKRPEGIEFLIEKNIITVSGINKQLVGNVAAKIRAVRPPEPYKGKGIRYLDEVVKRKVGKKAVTAG
jgi:large subunit ribosomal protein L6